MTLCHECGHIKGVHTLGGCGVAGCTCGGFTEAGPKAAPGEKIQKRKYTRKIKADDGSLSFKLKKACDQIDTLNSELGELKAWLKEKQESLKGAI